MTRDDLRGEELTDTADILVARTNALWDARDEIASIRSQLAAVTRERDAARHNEEEIRKHLACRIKAADDAHVMAFAAKERVVRLEEALEHITGNLCFCEGLDSGDRPCDVCVAKAALAEPAAEAGKQGRTFRGVNTGLDYPE